MNLLAFREYTFQIGMLPRNEKRLEELRQKISIGKQQIEQGKITEGELVFQQLKDKLKNEYGVS